MIKIVQIIKSNTELNILKMIVFDDRASNLRYQDSITTLFYYQYPYFLLFFHHFPRIDYKPVHLLTQIIFMIFSMNYKNHTPHLSLFLIVATYSYSCCDTNTLSIVGIASAQVPPDLATFSVQTSAVSKTSVLALSNMNSVVKQASKILQNSGIPATNFTTSGINLNPKYDYSSNPPVLIGQQALQSLLVTVNNITANKNLLAQLINSLGSINNITISGLSFENSDTNLAYRQARLAALNDARTKATQYANISGRKLGSIRNVVDQNRESYNSFKVSAADYSLRAQIVTLQVGQVQVSASVKVVWNLLN